MNQKVLSSAEDTILAAREFAEKVATKPCLIFLLGGLGAGKTTWCQGFISYFSNEPISVLSPTYSYVNKYDLQGTKIKHFDLYRVDDLAQLEELGLLEELEEKESYRLVEWPQILSQTPLRPDYQVELAKELFGK